MAETRECESWPPLGSGMEEIAPTLFLAFAAICFAISIYYAAQILFSLPDIAEQLQDAVEQSIDDMTGTYMGASIMHTLADQGGSIGECAEVSAITKANNCHGSGFLGLSNFDYDGVENVKPHPKGQRLEDTDLPTDLKLGLKRFWPNRTHESSVLKDAICALGFHRWHLIEVKAVSPPLKCNYCRWCSEIRVQQSNTDDGT